MRSNTFQNLMTAFHPQPSPHFLYPLPWPEGSYWIGHVLPSVLSSSFLGIGSLVFSEILHGVRGPYGDECDSARLFFWKKPLPKKCQKWSKNGVLDFLGKSINLFSGIYPSRSTNVRFLNVVKCRWECQGAVSSATDS